MNLDRIRTFTRPDKFCDISLMTFSKYSWAAGPWCNIKAIGFLFLSSYSQYGRVVNVFSRSDFTTGITVLEKGILIVYANPLLERNCSHNRAMRKGASVTLVTKLFIGIVCG